VNLAEHIWTNYFVHTVHIFPLVIHRASVKFAFQSHVLSKCDVFHQNIDGNMTFRYSWILIDHQIDEEHRILTKNEIERRIHQVGVNIWTK